MKPKKAGPLTKREMVRLIDADDTIWVDRKGDTHVIADMPIDYVESILYFLLRLGLTKKDVPKALFKRYGERHNVFIANNIKDLDAE